MLGSIRLVKGTSCTGLPGRGSVCETGGRGDIDPAGVKMWSWEEPLLALPPEEVIHAVENGVLEWKGGRVLGGY